MVIRVSELCALRLAGARANAGNDSRKQLAPPTASAVCSSRKVTMTPTRLYLFLLAILMCGVVAAQREDELHIPEENDNRYPPEHPPQKNMNSIDNSGTEVLEEPKPTGVFEESVGALEEPVQAVEETVGALEEPRGVLEEPAGEQEESVGVLAEPKVLETPPEPAGVLAEPARVLEGPVGGLDEPVGIPEEPEEVLIDFMGVPEKPEGIIEEPAGVLEGPVGVLDIPDGVQEEPSGIKENPTGVAVEPPVLPEGPVEVLKESMGILEESEGVKKEPTGLLEKPVGLEEPRGLLEIPEEVQDEPSGVSEEPTEVPGEPAGLSEEPTALPEEPAGVPEKPAAVPEETTGALKEPEGFLGEAMGVPKESEGLQEVSDGLIEEDARVSDEPTGALKEPEGVLEKAVGVPKESEGLQEISAGVLGEDAGVPEEPTGTLEEPEGVLEAGGVPKESEGLPEQPADVPEKPAAVPEEPTGALKEPEGVLEEAVGVPKESEGLKEISTGVLGEDAGVPEEPAGILEESIRVEKPAGVIEVPLKVPDEPAKVPADELAGILEGYADAQTEPEILKDSVGVLEEPAGISEEPAGISQEPAGISEEPAGISNEPAGISEPAGLLVVPTKVPELPLREPQEAIEATEQPVETSTEAVQQKFEDTQPTVHLNTMFKIEPPSNEELLCPKPCVCNTEGNSDDFNVDCTGYELTEFPAPLDPRTTSLNLQNNKLTTIPKELAALIKLKSLNVNNNSLTDIASGSISELSELKVLKLANNHLFEYPEDLKNGFSLTKLEELDLGGNDIRTELASETFTVFQSLKHLTLPSSTPGLLEDLCVALKDNLEIVCTGTCDSELFECPYESTKYNEDHLDNAPTLDMIAFRSALDNVDTLTASNDGINSTPNIVHGSEASNNDLFPPTIIDNTSSSDVVSNSGIIQAPEITRSNAIVETPKQTTSYNESDVKVGATTSKGGGIDKSVIGIIVACMVVIVAAIAIKKNWRSIRKRFSSNSRSATERAGRNGTNGTVPEEVPLQDKSPV